MVNIKNNFTDNSIILDFLDHSYIYIVQSIKESYTIRKKKAFML